ncbi:Canalicular multispecific organic anion transporter 2 [Araneus ventricosus]|uniref:Canalicular multispecific organic anion transporter 2 n=1 Tax=Araneus ventricosus TaxID=182803 RepID=A0A4Y2G434_ARAVE|nr:Canalicular multispecific organic anion transporter 2 [Araneus ventricosus]
MDFCNSTFWNWNAFWNADEPKLSSCFRHSVLVIVPCAILWVLSVISSIRDCCRRSGRFRVRPGLTPWTKFTVTKLVLTSVLILCSLAEGIYIFSQHNLKPVLTAKVYYTSVMFRTFTFVLALYLQFKQNRERKLNSYALSTFWLLFSVCNLFSSPVFTAFGVKLEEMTDPFIYTFRMITIIALTAQTLLSFFTDPPNSVSWNPQMNEFQIEQQPLLSRLFFSWMTKFVWYGYRNAFDIDNLPVLERKMYAMHAHQQFQKQWRKKQRLLEISTEGNDTFIRRIIRYIRHLSLILLIHRSIWPWILITAAVELICCILSVLPPILMDYIIQYAGNSEPAWHGYVYAASFFLVASLKTLLSVHNTNFLRNASFFVRPALSSAIYRKCLRLKITLMGINDLTEIPNLAAVTGPQVSEWLWNAHQMWSLPLRTVFLIFLLGSYIKKGFQLGIILLTASFLFIIYLEKKYRKSQEVRKELEELRIKSMSDVLKEMKTIKLCTWETLIMDGRNSERQEEAKVLKKMMFYEASIFFLWSVTPYLITLGFIVGFVFPEKKDLNPNVAFVTLLISNLLVSNCQGMQEKLSKGRESLRKVIDFLLREQLDESVVDDEADIKNAIEISAGTFQWNRERDPTLQDVTFSVPRGCLAAVVGPEDAGKGALFSAIIGDMYSSIKGSVRIMKNRRVTRGSSFTLAFNTTSDCVTEHEQQKSV